MVTNKMLRRMGFEKNGKEWHLRRFGDEKRRLLIRGGKIFYLPYEYGYWINSQEKTYQLQWLWSNAVHLERRKLTFKAFQTIVEDFKAGQWLEKLDNQTALLRKFYDK